MLYSQQGGLPKTGSSRKSRKTKTLTQKEYNKLSKKEQEAYLKANYSQEEANQIANGLVGTVANATALGVTKGSGLRSAGSILKNIIK